MPIPGAGLSKARVYGRPLAGTAGSNPAGGHECLLSVVRQSSLRRADHPTRAVLMTGVALSVT